MSREQRHRSTRERLRDSYDDVHSVAVLELGTEAEVDSPSLYYEIGPGAAVAIDDPLEALLDRVDDASPEGLARFASYDGRRVREAVRWVAGLPSEAEEAKARDDRDGNRVTAATLQRENRVRGKGGGGGSGRRRHKVVAFAPASIDDTQAASEGPPPRRFRVYGLTRGASEFYHRRPGTARAVLASHVAQVIADRRFPEPLDEAKPRGGGAVRLNFEVYGLSHGQVEVLRSNPGSARRTLHDYAIAHDRHRVEARDK